MESSKRTHNVDEAEGRLLSAESRDATGRRGDHGTRVGEESERDLYEDNDEDREAHFVMGVGESGLARDVYSQRKGDDDQDGCQSVERGVGRVPGRSPQETSDEDSSGCEDEEGETGADGCRTIKSARTLRRSSPRRA